MAQNIKTALNDLQTHSVIPDCNTSLLACLLSKGKAFHFPSVAIPRQLRRKNLGLNTNITFGILGGLSLKKELGRGAFGRVVLMNTSDSCNENTIAVKVQLPIGSLAWEFIILQRLEQRIAKDGKNVSDYSFPRPINFISLADGGILGMSAVSKTGLNLVDLSNFYTLKLGKSVPELIVFHYTSIALRIIDQLHRQGKILVRYSNYAFILKLNLHYPHIHRNSSKHCDVKPDNFVLSNFKYSDTILHQVNFSDLTLVDFGNAVDLKQSSDLNIDDCRNVLFCGHTARKDMQCVAMRNGQSWSYDADTFGVVCCAHVLLYGKHMEIKKRNDNRWAPSTLLKRYWKQDLWNEVFDTLLNRNDIIHTGLLADSRGSGLCELRKKIDAHLKSKARKLHELLSRQANILPAGREGIV